MTTNPTDETASMLPEPTRRRLQQVMDHLPKSSSAAEAIAFTYQGEGVMRSILQTDLELVLGLRSPPTVDAWKCAASMGTPDFAAYANCDWPVCGCDPKADKVIESLQERGLLAAPYDAGLVEAAQRVLDGLNARIDAAVAEGATKVPVFDGIAALSDALNVAALRAAPPQAAASPPQADVAVEEVRSSSLHQLIDQARTLHAKAVKSSDLAVERAWIAGAEYIDPPSNNYWRVSASRGPNERGIQFRPYTVTKALATDGDTAALLTFASTALPQLCDLADQALKAQPPAVGQGVEDGVRELVAALDGGFVTTTSGGNPEADKRKATFSVEWRGEGALAKCDRFYDAMRGVLES